MTARGAWRAGVAAALVAVVDCGGRADLDGPVPADASPRDDAGALDASEAGMPVPPLPTVDASLLLVPPPIILEVPSDPAGESALPPLDPSRFCSGLSHYDARPGRSMAAAYSRDGLLLAVASEDVQPNLRLFQTAPDGGAPVLVQSLAGHNTGTYGVSFSPDGGVLASGGWGYAADDDAKLWRVSDGSLITNIGYDAAGYASAVEFSHDGRLLAIVGSGREIEIWSADGSTPEVVIPFLGTYSVHFSPDDSLLLTAGTAGPEARLWRVADGAQVAAFKGHSTSVSDAVFSPDGTQVVTTGYDDQVLVWDIQRWAFVQRLLEDDAPSTNVSHAVWFDDDHIVTNDWNGGVRIWGRTADGTFTRTCTFSTGAQSIALAVSPDGGELVVGGGDGSGAQGLWTYR